MPRTGASFLIILTCPFFTSFSIYFLFSFLFSLAIDIFKGHRQLPVQLRNLITLLGVATLFFFFFFNGSDFKKRNLGDILQFVDDCYFL